MIKYEDIEILHLESSQVCNAACPVCNRRYLGGKMNKNITNDVLTLEKAQKWFEPDFISRLGSLILCGNLGDPMTTPELIPILKYFKMHNEKLHITMHTNGGGRTVDFWKDLAKVMWPNGKVVFSVDGLKSTNHIYRRNVKWDTVWQSMCTYVNAGGQADWEFLVFRHNMHQVDEARDEAERMGIKNFRVKDPYGFETTKGINGQFIEVLREDGRFDYHLYSKDTPEDFEAFPRSHDDADIIFDHTTPPNISLISDEYKKVLEERDISCYTTSNKEIYISADGNVFPCCFIAGRFYGDASFQNAQLREFFKTHSEESYNINTNTLKNIVNSKLWNEYIPSSWKEKDLNKKLFICSSFCGKCTK